MVLAWASLWIVLAVLDARIVRRGSRSMSQAVTQGVSAAVLSGVTFYLVVGTLWGSAPASGRNYLLQFAAWLIAWAPGILAIGQELKKKTIAELRDLAKDMQHEAVQGYTQMNKEHLLPALCKALGLDAHEHHAAAAAEKGAIKARMRELKDGCEKARSDGDHERLRDLRRQYHHLNHMLRSSAKRATLH